MVRWLLHLLLWVSFVVLSGCSDVDEKGQAVSPSGSSSTEIGTATIDDRSAQTPQNLEELVDNTGMVFMPDAGFVGANGLQADRLGYGVEELELGLFKALSHSEKLLIREISFSYTRLLGQQEFSFGQFPNLSRIQFGDTNLTTIRGLDETPVVHVSLTDVPLSDISPISGLEQVEYLWIRSTVAIERLPDLSRLSEMYRLAIQASPLESLDGIETLQRPVGLVLGMVNDISALELVDPENLPIAMFPEHQQAQPDIVARIKEMGFELYEHFD